MAIEPLTIKIEIGREIEDTNFNYDLFSHLILISTLFNYIKFNIP